MKHKNILKNKILVFSFVLVFFGLFFGAGKADAAATCICNIRLDDGQGCNSNADEYEANFELSIATQHSIASLLEKAAQRLNPVICKDTSILLTGNIFNGLSNDKINTPERCDSTIKSGSFSGTIATYNISCSVKVESAIEQTSGSGGGPATDCGNNPLGCGTIAQFKSLNKLNLTGAGGAQILIGRAIKAMMGVIGSITLLMFVAGGFMWMTAAGNAERASKAMRMITWSTLGIVVIFLGYVLVEFIFSAF